MHTRLARRLVVGIALVTASVGLVGLVFAPDERAMCEHMLELARAAGETPARTGIDEAACREILARRRAAMHPVRRLGYGICVVMADTLDEIGRC